MIAAPLTIKPEPAAAMRDLAEGMIDLVALIDAADAMARDIAHGESEMHELKQQADMLHRALGLASRIGYAQATAALDGLLQNAGGASHV